MCAADPMVVSLAVASGPRRAKPRTPELEPRALDVLTSSARAATFAVKRYMLVRARDNRLLARAIRRHLGRTRAS
jgi:hypothetical protein